MNRLVSFLYSRRYCIDPSHEIPHQPGSIFDLYGRRDVEPGSPESNLLAHLSMNAIGDYYQIDHLVDYSNARIRDILNHAAYGEFFPKFLMAIPETTGDQVVQNIAAAFIVERLEDLIESPVFMTLELDPCLTSSILIACAIRLRLEVVRAREEAEEAEARAREAEEEEEEFYEEWYSMAGDDDDADDDMIWDDDHHMVGMAEDDEDDLYVGPEDEVPNPAQIMGGRPRCIHCHPWGDVRFANTTGGRLLAYTLRCENCAGG